jgi:hypothetical protein
MRALVVLSLWACPVATRQRRSVVPGSAGSIDFEASTALR